MAYAAVFSLGYAFMNSNIRKFTKSECDELQLLRSTLERLDDHRYRGIDRSEINELEAQIRDAVWKVEDVLESYHLCRGVDEEDVEQEFHSFFKTSKKLREEYLRALETSCVAEEEIIVEATHDGSTTVGLSDLSEEIISGLLDDKSEGKMFTICGMAGIGKTHLARDVYHHPLIVQRFELRIWVSIGSSHKDVKNIFVDILAQMQSKPRDVFDEKDEDELRDLVWNSLLDKKYLVAFDDIWSQSVLSDCIDALPFNKNERSILITTRLLDVAEEWDGNQICEMPFLSDEESWDLLSRNVFAGKPFPTQLEKAGRKISEMCEGLPLLILAVADILRNLDQTEECWNKVAEKKTTTFPDAYDRIYKVLVSSYDYLLQQYKACFLYIGVFRQSHEIPTSKLITLWCVEGFHGDDRVLEVLVSSSLAIICKHSSNSRIKSVKLHCVYWYVSVTEARKNKLFHVLNKLNDAFIESPRRLSVQNNMLFGLKEVHDSMAATTSLTRTLLFTGEDHQYPVEICFNTMLLMKVLDALAIRFYEFPNEVLNLLRLEYLALTHNGGVPSSISKLQCLQILTLRRHHNLINLVQRDSTRCLPKEIWDLQNLLYLRIKGSKLPDPSHDVQSSDISRLYVNADNCTKSILRHTPALEKLGIEIELQPEGEIENPLRCLVHTSLLEVLESLTCVIKNPRLSSQVVDPSYHLSCLPKYLKKLSLKGLGYQWKYISAIGSLPNLEVLKLQCYAFRGPVWEIKDGEFLKLKYLLLEDIDVVHWTIEDNLPYLHHLIIRHCYKLKMIPYNNISGMAEIEVDECSPSVMEFEQQRKSNANPSHLRVVIKHVMIELGSEDLDDLCRDYEANEILFDDEDMARESLFF